MRISVVALHQMTQGYPRTRIRDDFIYQRMEHQKIRSGSHRYSAVEKQMQREETRRPSTKMSTSAEAHADEVRCTQVLSWVVRQAWFKQWSCGGCYSRTLIRADTKGRIGVEPSLISGGYRKTGRIAHFGWVLPKEQDISRISCRGCDVWADGETGELTGMERSLADKGTQMAAMKRLGQHRHAVAPPSLGSESASDDSLCHEITSAERIVCLYQNGTLVAARKLSRPLVRELDSMSASVGLLPFQSGRNQLVGGGTRENRCFRAQWNPRSVIHQAGNTR